ncbi:hypothetical protein JNS98_28570 [Klebsiella pneumoniae]|nr:hypothetical protein [Klebsiella pneumoniae]
MSDRAAAHFHADQRGGQLLRLHFAARVSMKVRGEQPQEIAGAATALLENAAPFPRVLLYTSLSPLHRRCVPLGGS